MRTTTLWALAMWAKTTLLLALLVGAAWWCLGTGSGWFWVALAAAGVTEWYVVRQLAREWAWEARATWWWSA
ncbi:hypothetical protein Ae406Ps2_3944 [Pseudonocardia sp. Ae406_Ps2]|uniref:hypothetical protein n=1 Tax=unclassified Pseudonocardia TaxID=2619320 RepID=UPI00094B0A34|nr:MULTISPECIES: hypothetical protein [unclassified Pseudonocardia]OLL74908.1 hypothetical protein Ae150APs1_3286c [Pseudonocardia sp. Ae150A_Ps1]OLL80899.1 hypothetical protein Ae168Ps1_3305c [Pseudonocardia sp. Ae168_Ps1]OLL84982.1 hypothetical protein Ae263Ps1_2037 [Pseudonocardia sp. Ae263_Ps1]OLL95001.1 hypothetical protein Ae356Ps1_4898c [Pseudonocardia sp. Ae356_Ps1]OLL98345.1 hypothetical protein Ae331Ps2_2012c [Pseudonocardia sp. Ae331_Ps2]